MPELSHIYAIVQAERRRSYAGDKGQFKGRKWLKYGPRAPWLAIFAPSTCSPPERAFRFISGFAMA